MPKDPNKPKGRMSSYAFFIQACREEHRRQKPDESVNFTDFSRQCARRWKDMNAAEKKPFEKMADNDKARYMNEMAGYEPPAGEGRRKGKKKDPDAPKRAMSGFFFFSQDNRGKIRDKNPGMQMGDISKQLGLMWGALSDAEKGRFNAMSTKDKKRYEGAMDKYRQRGGGGKKKVGRGSVVEQHVEQAVDEDDEDDDESESD